MIIIMMTVEGKAMKRILGKKDWICLDGIYMYMYIHVHVLIHDCSISFLALSAGSSNGTTVYMYELASCPH